MSKYLKGKKAPTVLMKMDIEGSEVDVLPDLLWSGAMYHIDTALIEFHTRLTKDQFRNRVLEDRLIYSPCTLQEGEQSPLKRAEFNFITMFHCDTYMTC